MCCMGRNPACFPTDPAYQWWQAKHEQHTYGRMPCTCETGGYCGSVPSFHRWLTEHGVELPVESMRKRDRGFDVWTADAVACAAGVHPSMWWPEWFSRE